MKIVSFETGQILFSTLMDEVRPASGFYLPDLIKEIGDRYGMASRPTDLAEANKGGMKFQMGRLEYEGRTIAIKQLDFFNDGLLATTGSSEDTEILFADLSSWLKAKFRFRDPARPFKRKYFSAVVVDFEKPLEPLFGALGEISKDYAETLKSDNGVDASPHLLRIAIGADPRGLPQFTQTQLLIERRNDSYWETNRYIATAPLATNSLLALLERLEKRL
jgi:hypothetical protein